MSQYAITVHRLRLPGQCSTCSTPITTGVRVYLLRRRDTHIVPGWLYLCDDCAEAIGEHAHDPEAKAIILPVGGVCVAVEVSP